MEGSKIEVFRMESEKNRRFEMALPFFKHLDLARLAEVESLFIRKDTDALQKLAVVLGDAAAGNTIRKLSAIYRATDAELKEAETSPQKIEALYESAAERPFGETYRDAVAFHAELLKSLGLTPDSSGGEGAAETTKAEKGKAKVKKTSADSQSEG